MLLQNMSTALPSDVTLLSPPRGERCPDAVRVSAARRERRVAAGLPRPLHARGDSRWGRAAGEFRTQGTTVVLPWYPGHRRGLKSIA